MRFLLAPLLVILVLLSSAFAGQITVNSIPYTVTGHTAAWIAGTDTWDTITIAGTRLTSTTSGITFPSGSHHYILLLRTGSVPDTIIYGTDSTVAAPRGLYTGQNSYSIIIRGGYLLHRPDNIEENYDGAYVASDLVNSFGTGIQIGFGSYGILIDSMKKVEVRGYAQTTISGGSRMITIRDNDSIINNSYAYTSRELFEASVLNYPGYAKYTLGTNDSFHIKVVNNTIVDRAHAAIYAAGLRGAVMLWYPVGTGSPPTPTWRNKSVGIQTLSVRAFINTGNLFLAGTDAGIGALQLDTTWLDAGAGLTNLHVRAFAYDGSYIYAGTYGGGVFNTLTAGLWSDVSSGLPSQYILSMATLDTIVFAGTDGAGVARSYDHGATWTQINSGLGNLIVHSMIRVGTNLFAGTEGGVYYSTNNGTTWTLRSTGLPAGTVKAFAASGSNLLVGIYGAGIYLSTDNGATWAARNTGLSNLNVQALIYERSSLYAGTYGGSGIYYSSNNGTSWAGRNNGMSNLNVASLGLSIGASLGPEDDTIVFQGAIPTGIVAIIDSNRIYVDSRNNRYPTNYGAHTGASNTNAYGITGPYWDVGTRITYNLITTGNTYLGGRGIMGVAARGISPDGRRITQIDIGYNTVKVNEGRNIEFPTEYYPTAFRLRQNCIGVRVHHNSFTLVSDTERAVSIHGKAYANYGNAASYEMTFGVGDPDLTPWNITFENNHCSLLVRTSDVTGPYHNSAMDFELCQYSDTTIKIRNNHFYSEGTYVINYGVYDGPANDVLMTGDTVQLVSNAITPKGTFNVGDYRGGERNIARDATYLGLARSDSLGTIHYYNGAVTPSGFQSIAVERTTTVYVIGSNGRPVTSATVNFTDAYGHNLGTLTTNANGKVTKVLRFGTYFRTQRDSSLFNLFTFTAQKGVSAFVNYRVTDSTYTDTITINTYGDGQWEGLEDIVDYETHLDTASTGANMKFFIRGPKRQVVGLNLVRTVGVFRGLTATYASRYGNFQYYSDGVVGPEIDLSVNSDAVTEDAMAVTQTDTVILPANFGGSTSPYTASFPTYAIDATGASPVQIARVLVPVPYQGIAVPAALGGNSAMMEIRGGSGAGTRNQDIRYTVTNNGGVTWSTPQVISSGWNTQGDIRSGIEPWGFNTGKAVVVGMTATGTNGLSSPPSVRMWAYNGTTWSSHDSVNLIYSGRQIYPHREYGFAVTPDSVVHIVMSDTSASANTSRIVDVYKKIGSAPSGQGWRMTVLYTSPIHVGVNASVPNAEIMPHLLAHCGVAEYSGTLRAVYSVVNTPYTDPANQVLYSRRLLSDSTWSNPIQISTHNFVSDLVMANPMPAIHRDRAVVGFLSVEGGVYRWYLVGILGSGTTTGAGPVTSIGTIISFTIDSLHSNY